MNLLVDNASVFIVQLSEFDLLTLTFAKTFLDSFVNQYQEEQLNIVEVFVSE